MALSAKRVEDGDAGRNFIALAASGKSDLERLVVGARGGGSDKVLEMHGRIRPVSGHVAHRVHQSARSATIKMRAALLFQHRPEIIGLVGVAIVVMENDLAGEFACAKFLAKGHGLRRSREIIQLEVLLAVT